MPEKVIFSLRDMVHTFFKYDVTMFLRRWKEHFDMFIAWYVIPKRIRQWIVIRAFCDVAGNDKAVVDVTYTDVMKNMK